MTRHQKAALFIRQLYVMLPYVLDMADNELQDKALRITANQNKCDAKSFFLPVAYLAHH